MGATGSAGPAERWHHTIWIAHYDLPVTSLLSRIVGQRSLGEPGSVDSKAAMDLGAPTLETLSADHGAMNRTL